MTRVLPGQGHLQVVRLPPGLSVPVALARYRGSGLVRFAEPDYTVSLALTLPTDPRFQDGTQWWLNNYGQNGGLPDVDMDAPEAWDVLHSASNIIVAVVDSGVRLTHEDLAANLWVNPADGTHGFNALTGNHDPEDNDGHGTHVAGLIAAVGNNSRGIAGVAWRARIMACKFVETNSVPHISDAIACIEFARTNGAHILNLSWGGDAYSEALSNALWTAGQDGILVVAAAGNVLRNTDVVPYYPASLPLDNLVSVGAHTRSNTVWNLSNYGATTVHLFAPGADIFSTGRASDASYMTRSGTSMAAAMVSGALALLREMEPDAPPPVLMARLLAAVDTAPAYQGKCVSGGRLNLRKLIDLPRLEALPATRPQQLRLKGVPGRGYRIAASTNLVDWALWRTNTTDFLGEAVLTDDLSTELSARFYRGLPMP